MNNTNKLSFQAPIRNTVWICANCLKIRHLASKRNKRNNVT